MRTTLLIAWLVSYSTFAAAELPPASERYADPSVAEAPDFQRHVVPLLGRLGCNGRSCHGSFQGRGGFRLSLFGYDFAMDHGELTQRVGDEGRKRVNLVLAADSLILMKPTLAVDHEGGKRFETDAWQYRLLKRWIEVGARGASVQQRLIGLAVSPAELAFSHPGDSQQLRVTAEWSDGTREDVTCLCRFQSNDDAIADVDANGHVKSFGHGDTHIVAFYDNGVAAVPVMVPLAEAGITNDPQPAATRVDELVLTKLKKLGIMPSAVCDDADFLRRISIDMTGTLPTPDEIESFLADSASDKRTRKIDQLLDSPAYAAWWANKLGDITGNSRFRQAEERIGDQLAEQWYSWLYARLRRNTPYDQIVAGIVTATSRSDGQSYGEYAAEMSSYLGAGSVAFADRDTLPHFWTRRSVEKPEEKALAVAHSFLGVRLQCAECHKHPFDRWTQDDFKAFKEFFASLRYGFPAGSLDEARRIAQSAGQAMRNNAPGPINLEEAAAAEAGKSVAWRELYLESSGSGRRTLRLLGDEVQIDGDEDPRIDVMKWMRRPDNPYFARAIVNRVWANYFHIGLIDPVDDLSPANPPSNPELLAYLADGFVAAGYDLKWLHRQITTSDTYQRSWRANETNQEDRRNFSRQVPRRIEAEVLYDALKQALAADDELVDVRENLDRRAIGHLATRMAGTYAQRVFGQPDRLIACDCERTNTPSLLQAVFMQNDPLIHTRLAESSWLQQIESESSATETGDDPPVDHYIRAAYLRTVSRPPTIDETRRARQHLDESSSIVEGFRDLMWALVNSKEFLLNH